MVLFIFLVAAFILPAQVIECFSSIEKIQADDDRGPFGNYTGSCSLRPIAGANGQHIMCFPNEAKTFQLGDKVEISYGGVSAWSINFVSAEFKLLFHLAVYKTGEKTGTLVFNSNINGWGNEEVHDVVPMSDEFRLFITNTLEFLKIEVMDRMERRWKFYDFTFAHRTSKPESDYKYLSINLARPYVGYKSPDAFIDSIKYSDVPFQVGRYFLV